jgi:flagellar basal-body rod protein FlgC
MINLLPGIQSSASALEAERVRMEVVSQNIANANVSNYEHGKPYQRQVVHFATVLGAQTTGGMGGATPEAIQVARIEKDTRPPRLIYNPNDPAHDANGWVAMPDINVHEEMVDLIAASRTFEANLAVVRTSRNMALQTLAIGKRS